jgi:hypothetical protein
LSSRVQDVISLILCAAFLLHLTQGDALTALNLDQPELGLHGDDGDPTLASKLQNPSRELLQVPEIANPTLTGQPTQSLDASIAQPLDPVSVVTGLPTPKVAELAVIPEAQATTTSTEQPTEVIEAALAPPVDPAPDLNGLPTAHVAELAANPAVQLTNNLADTQPGNPITASPLPGEATDSPAGEANAPQVDQTPAAGAQPCGEVQQPALPAGATLAREDPPPLCASPALPSAGDAAPLQPDPNPEEQPMAPNLATSSAAQPEEVAVLRDHVAADARPLTVMKNPACANKPRNTNFYDPGSNFRCSWVCLGIAVNRELANYDCCPVGQCYTSLPLIGVPGVCGVSPPA